MGVAEALNTNHDNMVSEFASNGISTAHAATDPEKIGACQSRKRRYYIGLLVAEYLSRTEFVEFDSDLFASVFQEFYTELENEVKVGLNLEKDILLCEHDSLVARAKGQLKEHPQLGTLEIPPLAPSRANKRRRVSEGSEDEDEQPADEESDEEQGLGDGEEFEEAVWVVKHREMYAALGITWGMPAAQERFAFYSRNPWFCSLSPRMQCVILYFDMVEPLDQSYAGETVVFDNEAEEIFIDVCSPHLFVC